MKIKLASLIICFLSYHPALAGIPKSCKFNCDESDKQSPWNFHVDFEDNEWKKYLKPNDMGSWKPFKVLTEKNGNKFMAITVEDGFNRGTGFKGEPTERSELETVKLYAFASEVWYGFKIKQPKNNPFLRNDRVLLSQFKNRWVDRSQPKPGSPLLSLSMYNRNELRIIMYPCERSHTYLIYEPSIRKGYRTVRDRNDYTDTRAALPFCLDFGNLEGKLTIERDWSKVMPLVGEEWTTYVIGIYNTDQSDGFIEVYQNQNKLFDWRGPTYLDLWPQDEGTNIRIGPYRDGHPTRGKKYPPQTFYYDDFIVGSSKEEITAVLWN